MFNAANAMFFMHGGWFPLVLGALIFLLLTTRRRGSAPLAIERKRLDLSMDTCASAMAGVLRVPGTAVYLNSDPGLVPSALLHGLGLFKVMHEHVLFVHIGWPARRARRRNAFPSKRSAPAPTTCACASAWARKPDVLAKALAVRALRHRPGRGHRRHRGSEAHLGSLLPWPPHLFERELRPPR